MGTSDAGGRVVLREKSQKSRSEFIVAPVMLRCQELAATECCVYSGVRWDVDAEKGLKGECDFIVAKTSPSPALRAPLLIVVEAQKNDREEGLAPCAAPMIAACWFHQRHKEPLAQAYGCVTTGETWQFLRLRRRELLVDSDRCDISQVSIILGILMAILSERV